MSDLRPNKTVLYVRSTEKKLCKNGSDRVRASFHFSFLRRGRRGTRRAARGKRRTGESVSARKFGRKENRQTKGEIPLWRIFFSFCFFFNKSHNQKEGVRRRLSQLERGKVLHSQKVAIGDRGICTCILFSPIAILFLCFVVLNSTLEKIFHVTNTIVQTAYLPLSPHMPPFLYCLIMNISMLT